MQNESNILDELDKVDNNFYRNKKHKKGSQKQIFIVFIALK